MRATLGDAFERYVDWIVLYLFLQSMNLMMEAGAYLVDEAARETLDDWARWPQRAGSVAILVAMVLAVRLARKKRQGRCHGSLLDEYVTETIKRSALTAFFLTVCLVGVLDVVTNSTQLPADFFIKLPAVSLLVVFSVCYFLLNLSTTTRASADG